VLAVTVVVVTVQATKVEDLQSSDYEDEIKRRSKRIFIPNWFTVDLKTGVRYCVLAVILTLLVGHPVCKNQMRLSP